MDQVSKRKTWTLWLALRQVQGPTSTPSTISTVHTLSRPLTAFGMPTEIIRYASFCHPQINILVFLL